MMGALACGVCGEPFVRKSGRGGCQQKYCGLRCKDRAHADRSKARRLADPAAAAAEQRRWLDRNRERRACLVRATKYGLTPDQQRDLVTRQGNACAICACAIALSGPHAGHLDHDHDTGQVRAFLCRHCNLMVGHAMDRPSRLRAAAAYLEKHAPRLRLAR